MKQLNRQVGKKGEEIAENYLRDRGYLIIDKNSSTKFGEIDLIAAKDGLLVFVEVKLKQTEDFGTPEEMIGKNKIAQVKRTAELYLLNNPQVLSSFEKFQIDAVCVVTGLGGEIARINHYENISF